MDSPSSSAVDAPKKRVMPSRSRRGVCDSDLLILETFKRQYEVETLIPLDTPFLLSTNSQAALNTESNTEAGIHINVVANERYFARPEVLKAFREQEIIQTPEFESIGESSYVGTRTRPRAEDATIDTSDAAYEKRHRKFETLEKRQRLREKEKLKYEHHKLKQRIKQLKEMDGSDFMSMPASYFSPAPPQASAELNDLAVSGSPYAQINGAVTSSEGERRRKEMLETATKLEKRYAYLLPPDRVRKTQDQPSDSGLKPFPEIRDEDESESERMAYQVGTSRRDDAMKFRIPARSSASTTPAPSPGGPKPATSKKPRATGSFKPVGTSRLRRGSISTTPSVVFFPDQESSTNDYNDVDMHDPDHIPTSTPGPYDEDDLLQIHASNTNGTSKAALKNGKGKKAARVNHGEGDEDGESEKALSEDDEPEAAHEAEPEIEAIFIKTAAKRGRKRKVKEPVHLAEQSEIHGDSEVKDLSSRLEQTTFRSVQSAEGPQNDGDTTEDMSIPPSLPFAQVESISAMRPPKRRRGAAHAFTSSIRTPSAQPGESGSAATRKYNMTRGKPFASYFDSITGEKVSTTGALLIAAVRKGRARATKSFGIDTPKFLDFIEFELPEWLHFPESEPGSPRLAMSYIPESAQILPGEINTNTSRVEEQGNDTHDILADPEKTESGLVGPSGHVEPTVPEGEPEALEDMDIDQPEVGDEDKTKNVDVAQQEPIPVEGEGPQPDPEPQVEEDNHVLPPAEDTESESRIRPRILSGPAEDDDEQLLW